MTHYQTLSSYKYYNEAVQQEVIDLRREKNRQAVQSFVHFQFTLVVFLLTITAIQQMPIWLPIATSLVEQSGISETIQTWVNQIK